jgi:hypothetical protein
MGGVIAMGPPHNAEKVFQVRERPGRLAGEAGE